jgi:nitroreductase
MDTFEAIKQRRSIKQFEPDYKIQESDIEKLLSLAILSPTSFNVQHWRFVLVKDAKIRKDIRDASWNQPQVTDASILLIICADLKAWQKQPERYWKNAPKETRESLVSAIKNSYKNDPQLEREECIRSCGIVAQTIMLASKDIGLDSCPMIGFEADKVAKIINLPSDHMIGLMIAIGKQSKPASPRGGQLELDELVFTDHF